MRWLQGLDVFGKTAEDARVRTRGGAVITLFAIVVIFWLLVLEIRAYTTITFEPQLQIDSHRGERMPIVLDVTFPNLPCSLMSLDAMDDAGEVQENLDAQFSKQDLDAYGQVLDPAILERQERERTEAIAARGEDYEGSCYGATPPEGGKCMTCEDVRKAWAANNWQFHDGSGFAQCVEEHYPQHIQENKDNGCRISGRLTVSKVVGKLHFAPGQSYFAGSKHTHDLSAYSMKDLPYDFSHKISHFSFGDHSRETLLEDPLQNHEVIAQSKQFVFRYFLKVVSTEIVFRNGTHVHTNQYSATHHESPLLGGRDEDHPHSAHGISGIPGVWVNYDISPMKVTNIEVRGQSFGQLLMNVFAIVGAVVTTGAVVDRGVYAVNEALKARKER